MKKIEITPDWILTKLSHSLYADGEGNISICSDINNSYWIELALKTLEISYTEEEYFDVDINISFELKLDDIKECPELYKELDKLNTNNSKIKKAD